MKYIWTGELKIKNDNHSKQETWENKTSKIGSEIKADKNYTEITKVRSFKRLVSQISDKTKHVKRIKQNQRNG